MLARKRVNIGLFITSFLVVALGTAADPAGRLAHRDRSQCRERRVLRVARSERDGNPHVAYFDSTNILLEYAKRVGAPGDGKCLVRSSKSP